MPGPDPLKAALSNADAMGTAPVDGVEQPCPLTGGWELVDAELDQDEDPEEPDDEADGS